MEPFKNLFSLEAARQMANALRRAYPAFPVKPFLKGLDKELEPRELKARMHLLADRIEIGMPDNPEKLFPLLCQALARDEQDAHGLRGFAVWPLTEMVARRGLGHFDLSMHALREMTQRFTAEFAIRPFIRDDGKRTLKQLKAWTRDTNEHVRRLASEGSRPLLPWGEHLPAIRENPDLTLPILEALKDDPSAYVTRSVANHLNDHSKAHPDWVLEVLQAWMHDPRADESRRNARARLARHACRTLLKAGHPRALELHGFAPASHLEVLTASIHPRKVFLGETLTYRLRIRNHAATPARVLFDYAIHHLKANGTLSPKVFKGRTQALAPGEVWEIQGQHSLKPVSTRRYHPGRHAFEARINGSPGKPLAFELCKNG